MYLRTYVFIGDSNVRDPVSAPHNHDCRPDRGWKNPGPRNAQKFQINIGEYCGENVRSKSESATAERTIRRNGPCDA